MTSTSGTRRGQLKPCYRTKYGTMYLGDAAELMRTNPLARHRERVQLIFTSPPFPLNRKKRYGNEDGDAYVDWVASFAPLLREYLTDTGSIVIEIGNGWEKGKPTMSTLSMEALLAFKRRGGLELCQEFICYNPARLPSPAQWVNLERCRVKDAFTRVWWMSPTSRPKANNRRVLTGYSDSMRRLLERGTYNPGRRPSEHRIGRRSFLSRHSGAIPPNVLVPAIEDLLPDVLAALPQLHGILPIANTASNDPFQTHCRKLGIASHPAKMPLRLVEFFIRLLTDRGDLVLDPFSGSNATGFVAERLCRRWLGIEKDEKYVRASEHRFNPRLRIA